MKDKASKFKVFILMFHVLMSAIPGFYIEKMVVANTDKPLLGFASFVIIGCIVFAIARPFFYKLASKY